MSESESTQSVSQTPTPYITSSRSSESGDEQSIIFDLIEDQQWEAVVRYLEGNPSATKCRNRVRNSVQYNLPLHEVCRRQPPLHVINLLLKLYDDAIHTPGQYGFLPLHIACGSGASYGVVTRLLQAFPAATRCRDDTKDSLPLHLAAQWGAPEDALMEILTTYPEGSLIRDAAGKTPLDHAHDLPEGKTKQFALSALEAAPILVATSKAASRRIEDEMESKIRGIKEAHKEYIRQMERRHEHEKKGFLQLEIEFHNELAAEKERNCELAEAFIKLQEERDLLDLQFQDTVKQRLEEQHNDLQARWERQQQDIKVVLKSWDAGIVDSMNTMNNGELLLEESPTVDRAISSTLPISSSSLKPEDMGNLENISRLVAEYHKMKAEYSKMNEALRELESQVYNMNNLLQKKDQSILLLASTLETEKGQRQQAITYLQKLAAVHERTLQDMTNAKNEIKKLKKKGENQNHQLQESRKLLQEQDNRMQSIKSLLGSLYQNVRVWTSEQDASHVALEKEDLHTIEEQGQRADFDEMIHIPHALTTSSDAMAVVEAKENVDDKVESTDSNEAERAAIGSTISADQMLMTETKTDEENIKTEEETAELDDMEMIENLSTFSSVQLLLSYVHEKQEDGKEVGLDEVKSEEMLNNECKQEGYVMETISYTADPLDMENIKNLSAILLEESGYHSCGESSDYVHDVHVSVDEEGNDENNLGMEVTVFKTKERMEGSSEETAMTSEVSKDGADDEDMSMMSPARELVPLEPVY